METTTELILSPNFKKIANDEKALIYGGKTGKSLILRKGALQIVEMLEQGGSPDEI